MRAIYFSPAEINIIKAAFAYAEWLIEAYFRLGRGGFKNHRYDVQTLVCLQEHEIHEEAFAHLCRYYYQKGKDENHPDNFYFFRICLQDSRILDAVSRGQSFIKLVPLLIYIATHELVHVLRFSRGESDIAAPGEEKIREEEKVHLITRTVLQPVANRDLSLVLDCFRDGYYIGYL